MVRICDFSMCSLVFMLRPELCITQLQFTQSCLTLCNPISCSMPGFPAHHQLPEFAETHVHRVCEAIKHLIFCRPLLLLPSIFASIKVSDESILHIRWPEYWSFSFSISPSCEYSGLISFRIVWFHLLAVQGTLKSLFQHHSSKSSSLQPSAFSTVHLSNAYMTSGKSIALTRWTFVDQVMSLLFNMLSKLAMAFPTGSNFMAFISWLQSPSAVILEPKKIKSDTVSTVSQSISHEEMGLDAMIFIF